jgi:16S rRNA (cytosine967-C5)-methyltransferase
MANRQPAGKKSPAQSKAKAVKVSLARQAAIKCLRQVFSGQSLSAVQAQTIEKLDDRRDRGLANELVNGVLRWRWQLEFFISVLLSKPLKAKDIDVQLILLMALYEINECRTPDYAIINEAVELVRKSGKKWAASLVNAVLRRFTREREQLVAGIELDVARYSHPQWMVSAVKRDWPADWQAILQANNQRPAFWLRINRRQDDVAHYQQRLSDAGLESQAGDLSDSAIRLLHGIDVTTLPGFDDGAVSVQDAGAQLTAELLNLEEGQKVLDLCAAPGGKTCHILEHCENLRQLVAVEFDEQRMKRVQENLQRLKLAQADEAGPAVELIVADARDYQQWWQGETFDRILIDAPCSASGVIRRHPDIKTLRRESDIQPLVQLQAEILAAAWKMLAPGGELLYITCSIFKDENQEQIRKFLSSTPGASEIRIAGHWGRACDFGRQLLPGELDADGFYFCRLKNAG